MNILVTGCRSLNGYEELCKILDKDLSTIKDLKIITGDSEGTEELVIRYAKEHDIDVEVICKDPEYGYSDWYKRNCVMVEKCDRAILFWDGVSKGTKRTIDICVKKSKGYSVYTNMHL